MFLYTEQVKGPVVIFPVGDIIAHFQRIHLAHHFVYSSEAQFRHDLSQLLGNEAEKINHMAGVAGKSFA
jgi:hypothetical protein